MRPSRASPTTASLPPSSFSACAANLIYGPTPLLGQHMSFVASTWTAQWMYRQLRSRGLMTSKSGLNSPILGPRAVNPVPRTSPPGTGPWRRVDRRPIVGPRLLQSGHEPAAAARTDASTAIPPTLRTNSTGDNRAARQNLIAAWNDWSLQLCDEQQFAAAAAELQACLQFAPLDPTTLLNDVHVHHGWVTALCARRQFEDALALLHGCHIRRPRGGVL